MLRRNGLVSLGLGGLVLAGFGSQASAAIGIYYAEASMDSMWGFYRPTPGYVSSPGLAQSDFYGSKTGNTYLPGTWTFDHTSTISAPTGVSGFIVGTTGYASGQGVLNTSLSSEGFSISGSGYGEVQYDPTPGTGTDADTLYGNGTATLSFNFVVPVDGNSYSLKMASGTASADAYSIIMVRLAGTDTSGKVTTLIDFQQDGTQDTFASDSWTGQEFSLANGSLYVLDVYANPNFPYADATYPDRFSAISQFNLVGTFVPEPTAFGVVLGASLLTLRRRRDRVMA